MYNTISPVITQQQNQNSLALSSKLNDVRSRKRAYIDFLGAFYLVDYLNNKGFRASTVKSIFKCPKLYLDFELIDIYCNSHMLYVVTTSGTDFIKIPALHKKYDIIPTGYIIVDYKLTRKEMEIKGVITPEDFESIEPENGYYRFDIKNLKSIDEFLPVIKKYTGVKSSVGRHLECMKLFVPYADDKLKNEEKQQLIKHILTCETCKKRLIDTINFDKNSKSLNEHKEILSTEDKIAKENFINKLKTAADKNVEGLQGAIDVIYQNEGYEKLKNDSFEYKADTPMRIKKLILLFSSIMLIFVVFTAFLFNIPAKKPNDISKTVAGAAIEYSSDEDGNYSSDYDIAVPKVSRDKRVYTNISKVSWEVSSEITNEDQKRFLQMAGKSIRLNLQNDLLLSNQIAVNNRVKFDIRFLRDGSIDAIEINESSGTTAVDDLLKQSVENTLYYMRPPKGSFTSKRNSLVLNIEF